MERGVLRRGSKKGLSRRHLKGRSTPFREYDPVGVCPICALMGLLVAKADGGGSKFAARDAPNNHGGRAMSQYSAPCPRSHAASRTGAERDIERERETRETRTRTEKQERERERETKRKRVRERERRREQKRNIWERDRLFQGKRERGGFGPRRKKKERKREISF